MNNSALSPESLIWFIDCSLRITLLALGVAFIAQILQRRSALLAHRISVTTLVAAPVISMAWALPTWPLPTGLSPVPNHADSLAEFETSASSAPPTERTAEEHSPLETTLNSQTATRFAAETPTDSTATLKTDGVIQPASEPFPTRVTAVSALGVVWLFIAIFLSVRTAMAIVRLHRLLNECTRADSDLQEQVETAASEMGIRQRFQVRLSQRNAMPFVAWLGGWSVVLPASFGSWSDAERTAVLTHELGHVARRDCIADLLARTICCVAWPHLFLHFLRRMIERLREPACDEWAVTFGCQDAATYGTALLNVVSRCQPVASPLVSSMAGPGELESRVRRLAAWQPQRSVPNRVFRQLASVVVVLLTFAIATAQQQQPESGAPRSASTDKQSVSQSDGATISVNGSVATTDGSPVADALVFLQPHYISYRWQHRLTNGPPTLIGRSTTDPDGTFRFDKVAIPSHLSGVATAFQQGYCGATLFIWAQSRGYAHAELQALNSSEPLKLRLRRGVLATGMVVDEDGQPIAEAKVGLGYVSPIGDRPEIAALALGGDGNQIPLSVMTNEAGIFEFGGLPSYCHANLSISVPGFTERTRFGFQTETGKTGIRHPGDEQDPFQIQKLYRIPLRRERLLSVRVLDDQGTLVKSGRVTFRLDHFSLQSSKVADDGTATLDLNKCREGINDLEVVYSCDPHTPRPGATLTTQISDWEQTPERLIEVRLPKPRWATGMLLDAATNEPVSGRLISYSATGFFGSRSSCFSGDDGSFRIPVVSGKGILRSGTRFNNSTTFQPEPLAVDIPDAGEGQPLQPITMHVSHGRTIHGRVTNANGLPAGDVVVWCGDKFFRTDNTGLYTFSSVSPFEDVMVTAWSDHGGATHVVAAADTSDWPRDYDTPVDLQLNPGVTLEGRILRDGPPVADTRLDLYLSTPDTIRQFHTAHTVRTNETGEYTIRGLRRGQRYRLKTPGQEIWHWKFDAPYRGMIDADETRSTITLPDAWIGENSQTLAGIVKDNSGTPLANVTVQTCWLDGARLTHQDCDRTPTTQTDSSGRFSIRGLPNAPLVLRAITDPVTEGADAPTSEVTPARNAFDVEISLDYSDVN